MNQAGFQPGALPTWLRLGAVALSLTLGAQAPALAAPAAFPTVTTPVKLDGRALATPYNPNWYEALNTIVYDAGTYHLWYVRGSYGVSIDGISHATSTDGINFTTQNALTLPPNWWTAYGATVEPTPNYLRVSRDGAGNWILMVWHPSAPNQGQFNYNTSLWLLDSGIADATPTLIGPLPSWPGGNHVGAFGIVGSNLYLGQDTAGAFGRYTLSPTTTTSPPVTLPVGSMPDAANAYAGTGLCSFAICPGDVNSSYIHNYGRTLDQGGGVLGTYYDLRDANTWTRRAKQLWYMESTDGGASWSGAQPLFTNGSAVTVDGLPNTGNFSLPEVAALGGGQYRSYFNTMDACGNYVTVTAALPGTEQGLTVAKAFSPAAVAPGGSSQLTVTLTAPAASCTPAPTTPIFTGLGFTDTLPAGVTVAATPNASTTCAGATPTAIGGAGTFSLANASLAPGASCTATVTVSVAGAGTFRNTIRITDVNNTQNVPVLADAVADLQAGSATVAPVPTLGEFAMAALALLLGALGLRHVRPAQRR